MRISICIPTYNQVNYLQLAIKSALEQSVKPFEIIVSNDCSTDFTKELLDDLSNEIPILKVINQPKNLGIAKNTDACLRASTGNFVVRLDSDDRLAPQFCEVLSKLLECYPAAGYAHSNVEEIDQLGQFINKRTLYRKLDFQSSDEALIAAAKGYRVAANIIMFRKEALESVNYISNRPDYVEDYHLSADIAFHGWGNVFSNEYLSFYRVWIDTGRVRQRRKMLEIKGLYRVFSEVLEPAFQSKEYDVNILIKNRKNLACIQSDCLGWGVYSEAEKDELAEAIWQLSPSSKVKTYIWLHVNGYGWIINNLTKFKKKLNRAIKKVINLN